MKTLLLINYEYPPVGAGAANATFQIAKSLCMHHNTAVTVLTARYGNLPAHTMEGNATIIRCKSLRRRADRSGMVEKFLFIIGALMALPAIVRSKKIDGCIAFFSIPCGPVALIAKMLYGIPYVVSLRGGDVPGTEKKLGFLHTVFKPLRRSVLAKARAIIANSQGLKRAAEAADPFPVNVIPNGVDSRFFAPRESADRSDEIFRLLFAGRFHEQKNLFLLLEHFAALKKNAGTHRVELHLVGDGPLRRQLEDAARQLNITDSVKWYGWLGKEALLNVYRQCDCFINPSIYEGSPNTVLEAMACGLPVIASDIMGNNELVRNGETGFLFDLSNASAIAEKASWLMHDREGTFRMGRKARSEAEAGFSWERVAAAYLELFS